MGGGGSGGGNGTSTSSSAGPNTTAAIGSATTVAGSGSGTRSTGATGTAQFTVDPTSVDFTVIGTPRQATVKVRNTGEVPLTIKAPTVSGSGAAHFVAGDVNCTGQALAPGRSCDIQVAFSPKAGGAVSAVVAVAAAEASKQIEVQVKGSSLLG
jgi:hypothetical protein